MISSGDATAVAQQIAASSTLFRIGIVCLILFGIHLLLIGYLAHRAGYLPKVFGVLVLIAGLGYLVDGIGIVLRGDHTVGLGQFTFVGEVALIFWLLISGRRHDFRGRGDPVSHRDLAPVDR